MPSDYNKIRQENELKYGTEIGRIGKMLLADRYDKRTHFIFELLQNTEDALARRGHWTGSRGARFELSRSKLLMSHYGEPFNEADVRAICGIDESSKEITSIGCFGIGFKSVYAFTDSPEIHSGDEDFAIESYVRPKAVTPTERDGEQTVISLPLNHRPSSAYSEIASALQNLGSRVLLFLRHVDDISWTAQDGSSGLYLRT